MHVDEKPDCDVVLRQQEQPWPAASHAWYTVGVLTFAYMVSFVDRQILSLLIEPIRNDLNISDTEVSLVSGIAFSLFFTLMGIPIGWLADNKNRRLIIAIGVTFWSLFTAFCGLARTFGQLFMARMGIGIGEAALTPSAFSMLADYFPPHRLGRAMGIYMSGPSIGSGLALIFGGVMLAMVEDLPRIALPFIGTLQPWQLAFICASLLGIPAVVLMATVREPTRRGGGHLRPGAAGGTVTVPFRAVFIYARAGWRTYLPLFVGFAAFSLLMHAFITWIPTMYIRTYGWDASSIGYTYGFILMVFGPLGAISGGWIADSLRRRGCIDAPVRILIISSLLITLSAGLLSLMPSAVLSLVVLATFALLQFMIVSVMATTFQLVTPNHFRAQIAAITILVANLIGGGIGPTVVALITDYGFGYDMALHYSLSIVAIVFGPLAALIFWAGLRSYRSDIAALKIGVGQ